MLASKDTMLFALIYPKEEICEEWMACSFVNKDCRNEDGSELFCCPTLSRIASKEKLLQRLRQSAPFRPVTLKK